MRTAVLAIIIAVLGLCVGCGTSGGGTNGDCNLRVRLDGVTYDPTMLPGLTHDLVREPYATGAKLPAKEIDCDGSTIDDVQVQQIQGVALADAVYVDDGSGDRSPYFSTTLRSAPIAFRAATLPVRCQQPVTFTGSLDSIGDQDYSSADLVLPYKATVLASSGDGLPFQEWQAIRVDVSVTAGVSPYAPSRTDIDTSIADRKPVTVTAHCDGSGFVADTFRLSS